MYKEDRGSFHIQVRIINKAQNYKTAQWSWALAAQWNHLESFKRYWCLPKLLKRSAWQWWIQGTMHLSKPTEGTTSEWTLMEIMDHRWLWSIRAGLSIVTSASRWRGGGQRQRPRTSGTIWVYGTRIYKLSLNFAMKNSLWKANAGVHIHL